ncbi:MAG TPA: hypothetical protein VFC09_11945 [Candidatus Dormibacteraeota bacterium]|nr:hypothetical protein [Candidatus Dormibacteraeota bacterium]
MPDRIDGVRGMPLGQWLRGRRDGGEPFPTLPDQARFEKPNEIGFATGALDGVAAFHGFGGDKPDLPGAIVRRLAAVIDSPEPGIPLRELYAAVVDRPPLDYIDKALTQLRNRTDLRKDRLHAIGHWLLDHSTDRNPVKLGIALLPIEPCGNDDDLLRLFGGHDEFTLYAVVAAANVSVDPEPLIFEVAKSVHGWGRIHAVRRLLQTSNPEIKDWLLVEGFRNGVMNEYLAYGAAVAGDLLTALNEPSISDPLFHSAGELLAALVTGGPAEDIGDYDHPVDVVEQYLRHAEAHELDVDDLHSISMIRYYVADTERLSKGSAKAWTAARRQRAVERCVSLVNSAPSRALLEGIAATPTSMAFARALPLAKEVGIDVMPGLRARIAARPEDAWAWAALLSECDANSIDDALTWAQSLLPITEIGTGPDMLLGLGPHFAVNGVVDTILRSLRKHPGYGVTIVEVALKSPVIRNRWGALLVLGHWTPEKWPEGIAVRVQEMMAVEPQDKTRRKARDLLAASGHSVTEQD